MKVLLLAFICLTLVQCTAGLSQEIFDKTSKDGMSCELRYRSTDIQCDPSLGTDDTEVDDMTLCWEWDAVRDEAIYYRCEGNLWVRQSGTDVSVNENRERRLFGLIIGIAAAVTGGIICIFICPRGHSPPPNTPPRFTKCKPSQTRFTIDKEGATSMAVHYDIPKATDNEDGKRTPRKKSGPGRGETVLGGLNGGKKYTIIYMAKDEKGLTDSCDFTLTVEAKGCNKPTSPRNGYVDCKQSSIGLIYGNTCSYECKKGYKLMGQRETKCLFNQSWSHNKPTCEVVKCPQPQHISNGNVVCTKTGQYTFGTTCSLKCVSGFAPSSPKAAMCTEDGTWSYNFQDGCKDIEPPTINCFDQTFYVGRSDTKMNVAWKKPTAKDNVDSPERITIIRSGNGPREGEALPVGDYYAKYKAADSEGNVSPECVTRLQVKEILCGHPADSIVDDNLKFNCSNINYKYGTDCSLSCQYSFPLNGSDTISCERNVTSSPPVGFWSYSSPLPPSCTVVTCPDLDPPLNGALSYETQNLRPIVIMSCNDKYDIPYMYSGFLGVLFCLDSGNWSPYSEAPDCSAKRYASRFILPAELYYTGNCSDEGTQKQIKEAFLNRTAALKGPFTSVCPPDISCSIDNVTVECGLSSRRKRDVNKRSTSDNIFVTFNLALGISVDAGGNWYEAISKTYDPALKAMKDSFAMKVKDGQFNIPNLNLGEDAFQTDAYGDFSCPPGQIKNNAQCKSCPLGYLLDDVTGRCMECPKGTYMDSDGGTHCTACPDGFSTKGNGSKSSRECIELCEAGFFSYDEVHPCEPCPQGQYQRENGKSRCLRCERGKTTLSVGSKAAEDCQDFSVVLEGARGASVTDVFLNDTESLTVNLWIQAESFSASPLVLQITAAGQAEPEIVLSVSNETSIKIRKTVFTSNETIQDSDWHMVTLVLDGSNWSMSLNIDGIASVNGSFQPSSGYIITAGAFFEIVSGKDICISGLSVSETVLSQNDMSSLLSVCSAVLPDTVIGMDTFLQSGANNVSLVVPTSCDPINECKSSPCGENKCLNGIGDYTCHCSNMYTGKNCTIPPDYCDNSQCQNGATCVNQAYTYTCDCPPGFTGAHCQVAPVDGGWGDWTPWSTCTVTCGIGTQLRSRVCDSPAKDAYGNDCEGVPMETQSCNSGECRECPDIGSRPFGVIRSCTGTQDTKQTCTYKCRNGAVLANGLKMQTYKCGLMTNYEWEPDLNPISCSNATRPNYLSSTTTATTNIIPDEHFDEAKQRYLESVSSTACVTQGLCTASVSLDSNNRSRKRSTGTTSVSVSFKATFKETGILDIDALFENNTVSPALKEWLNTVIGIETTAQQLANDSHTLLNITVGGVSYDVLSSTTAAATHCDEGYTPTEAVCAACPLGTRFESGYCVACEIGTYQDQTAKIACIACPVGYTTASVGAMYAADCSVINNQTSPATDKDTETSNTVIIIVCSVSGVVVLGIAVAALVYCKYKSKLPMYVRRSLSDFHAEVKPMPFDVRKINQPPTTRSIMFSNEADESTQ